LALDWGLSRQHTSPFEQHAGWPLGVVPHLVCAVSEQLSPKAKGLKVAPTSTPKMSFKACERGMGVARMRQTLSKSWVTIFSFACAPPGAEVNFLIGFRRDVSHDAIRA